LILIFLIGVNLPIAKRFLLLDDYDVQTLNSRVQYANTAYDSFKAAKFLGVGYGNFQKIADPLIGLDSGTNSKISIFNTPISLPGNPHNQFLSWLSETGIIGVMVYVLLLGIFLKSDFDYIRFNKSRDIFVVCLIVSSWVLIVASILDAMATNLFYMFYIIRGLLLGNYLTKGA
jgi:O-antigen ligase